MIFDLLRRKDTRIVSASDLERFLRLGSETAAGVTVTPESGIRHAPVFACARVLAESVGQTPCHLYRRDARSRVKAEDHPLYGVLHYRPNHYQTPQEFSEYLVACLAQRGNAYSLIDRTRGRVRALLPIAPALVTPRETDEGAIVYDVAQRGGGKETYPAAEVFHVPLFPIGRFVGASPITYAREAIGLGVAMEKHGASFFRNGARPGGVLSTDQVLGDEGAKNVAASWNEAHAGAENAHKVAVLEFGLKYTQIGLSAEDSQWIEARKLTRSEIAGLFRVPPHLIGDLDRATFSNIEQQAIDFVTHALVPYFTRIEQRIALQLLDDAERGTYFAKFNERHLMRGDMAARAEFYTRQVQNGALSPNEVRELEDLNPREGGDVYLTPANMLIDGKAPPAK